jgi:hypothetical protein
LLESIVNVKLCGPVLLKLEIELLEELLELGCNSDHGTGISLPLEPELELDP